MTQWIVSSMGPLSLLIFAIVPASVFVLAQRRWFVLAVFVVVASPLSVSFATGILTWYRGGGYMMGIGYGSSETASIDQSTRLPKTTSGCLVEGDEWVQAPYNLALRLMTSVAGLSKGAYDGPIPTESEARAALLDATPLPWQELVGGNIELNLRRVKLSPHIGAALIDACYFFDPIRDAAPDSFAPIIRGAIWKARVLIIGIGGMPLDLEILSLGYGQTSHVVAIDINAGKPFVYFGGHGFCRGLPLVWQNVEPRILDMDLRTSPPI